MKRIAVIGGGIAGLAAAYQVTKYPDWELTLFETSGRLGGTVETVRRGGFTIETGPDSWVSEKRAARELAEELGLGAEIIQSNDAVRRTYLARGSTLTPMPDGLRMMVPTRWEPILESPLFSQEARQAYLREPERAAELKRHAATRGENEDESVRSFVTRHFGAEATETIAGPLLAGVFGGDIDRLSARAVLLPFMRLEEEHGSLIAPIMARVERDRAEGRAPEPVFTTLRSGLGSLVDRLAAALPQDSIRLETPVVALAPDGRGWRVSTAKRGPELFDAVVLAIPGREAVALLTPADPEAAALLRMEASSAIVVALCFAPEQVAGLRVPRGFGFLVPPAGVAGRAPQLLAATFMDQKFPDRAPEGASFLRGFFGGDTAPRMMDWEDERIAEAARAHLARLLGPVPAPTHTVVRRWPQLLPQYSVGHPARMRKLEERCRDLPGLGLTGNAYDGVGLPALVHHARQTVRSLTGGGAASQQSKRP